MADVPYPNPPYSATINVNDFALVDGSFPNAVRSPVGSESAFTADEYFNETRTVLRNVILKSHDGFGVLASPAIGLQSPISVTAADDELLIRNDPTGANTLRRISLAAFFASPYVQSFLTTGGGSVLTDGLTMQGDGTLGSKIALKKVFTDPLTILGDGATALTKLTVNPAALTPIITKLSGINTVTHNSTFISAPFTRSGTEVYWVAMYATPVSGVLYVGEGGAAPSSLASSSNNVIAVLQKTTIANQMVLVIRNIGNTAAQDATVTWKVLGV